MDKKVLQCSHLYNVLVGHYNFIVLQLYCMFSTPIVVLYHSMLYGLGLSM